MTDYNDKARAVILAALMVFSVFAGTVAFTGAASGLNSTGTSAIEDFRASGPSTGALIDENTQPTHDSVGFNVTNVSGQENTELQVSFLVNGTKAPATSVNNLAVENGGTSGTTEATSNGNVTGVVSASNDGDTVALDFEGVTVDYPSVTQNEDIDIRVTAINRSDTSQTVTTTFSSQFTLEDVGTGSGPAGATRGDGSGGDFDTRDGEGVVYIGATVYQGESDIELADEFTSTPTKDAGNDEGITLQTPDVAQSQATGSYSDSSGNSVVVEQPRVTTLDIENQNGEDISGGSVYEGDSDTGAGELDVVAGWNYRAAEDLEVTVEDEDGLDVTGDAIQEDEFKTKDDYGSVRNNRVLWDMDLSDIGTGTYTVTVEGSDDLDFGEASQSTTITVTGDDNVQIDLSQSTATRGEDVRFDITGSNAGDQHVVTIENTDFRDSNNFNQTARIFRNAGDTEEVGIVTEGNTQYNRSQVNANAVPSGASIAYAYAIVEVDDDTGIGVGQIETGNLDTTSVEVNVYGAQSGTGSGADEAVVPDDVSSDNEEDDTDLEVEEGSISIGSPTGAYAVGSEVDINGTADEGINEVAFYVRRQGDYQLLEVDGDTTVNVDGDGTFEQEDVVLSEGSEQGNSLLSLPGTYRLGAIDAADVGGSTPRKNVTTSNFNTGTSTQSSIRVVDTELSGNVHTIGGQVALTGNSGSPEDVDINGTALGADNVYVVFVGERGQAYADTISVDSDNTFEEEDFTIGRNFDEGRASVHLLIPGRDGGFGDDDTFPTLSGGNTSSFTNYVNNNLDRGARQEAGRTTLTGEQIRSQLLDQTAEDTSSDDRIVTQTFRFADSQTTIQNVYPEGMEASGVNPVGVDDTLVAEGRTNLRPDDNSLTLELLTEQDGESVALASTDEWQSNGRWSLSLDLEDVQTGTYTLEVDDGDNTDISEVEIVQNVETATPEPTPTEEPTATPTATAEPTPEPTPEPTEEPTATATPTPTEGGGPGFGALVAVIALIAAALLAVRRDD